jgi:hypothetical protein
MWFFGQMMADVASKGAISHGCGISVPQGPILYRRLRVMARETWARGDMFWR